MRPQNIFELNSLYKEYENGYQALNNITLSIPEGKITGIIGKSGAGKSTLLRCLNLLESPTSGTILFENNDIQKANSYSLKSIRQKIGMIFQHFNLMSRRTAIENVMLPLELAGKNKKEAADRALECLKLVGISNLKDKYPSKLSGGQKQRVAIARAIACNTKILLCDEATSALDPDATKDILKLLKTLNNELNISIILITHEIFVIKEICDLVIVMDQGDIIEQGLVKDIFTRPTHNITKTFIQSVLNANIPKLIQEQLKPEPSSNAEIALRLEFQGQGAEKPLISNFIKDHNIDINIVGGYIENIGDTNFGTLIITTINDKEVIMKLKEFLNKENVQYEVLGYLPCMS